LYRFRIVVGGSLHDILTFQEQEVETALKLDPMTAQYLAEGDASFLLSQNHHCMCSLELDPRMKI
jgi:hypothetical protein